MLILFESKKFEKKIYIVIWPRLKKLLKVTGTKKNEEVKLFPVGKVRSFLKKDCEVKVLKDEKRTLCEWGDTREVRQRSGL